MCLLPFWRAFTNVTPHIFYILFSHCLCTQTQSPSCFLVRQQAVYDTWAFCQAMITTTTSYTFNASSMQMLSRSMFVSFTIDQLSWNNPWRSAISWSSATFPYSRYHVVLTESSVTRSQSPETRRDAQPMTPWAPRAILALLWGHVKVMELYLDSINWTRHLQSQEVWIVLSNISYDSHERVYCHSGD